MQAQQLGQGRIREEPLTNGVGGIYLIGKEAAIGRSKPPSCRSCRSCRSCCGRCGSYACAHSEPCRAARARAGLATQRDWQPGKKEAERNKQDKLTSSRMRPLSRIAAASFRTAPQHAGDGQQRIRASAGGAGAPLVAQPAGADCTTDSRRSCQTPVFARSGGALAWFVRPAVGATPSNIVLCEPGLCERPVGNPVR